MYATAAKQSTTASNIIQPLPFNTAVQVIRRWMAGWSAISPRNGQTGFAASEYIWTHLPEPSARLHRVEAGVSGTAIAIAEASYGDLASQGGRTCASSSIREPLLSVAVLITFKAKDRDPLYIPVATQGAHHALWLPAAERLGPKWVALLENGPVVDVGDLPAVMDEPRKLRDALAGTPANASLPERIDWILEGPSGLDPNEVSEIVIG